MPLWFYSSTLQRNGHSPKPPISSPQADPSARTRTLRREPLATQVSLLSKPWEILVSRGAEGLDNISLLSVKKDSRVSFLHYLFQVGESAYEDFPGKLFAIRGDIPAYGIPAIMRLEAIHFAANSSFVGTPRLEFESHITGLTSSVPQNFKDRAYQPAVDGKDDGVRLVKSRGLEFVPCATAEIALEQGPRALITEVISRAFAGLGIQDRTFDPELDCMQDSFTAQVDGN